MLLLVSLLHLPHFSSDSIELLFVFLDSGSYIVVFGVVISSLHVIHRFDLHLFQIVLGLVVFIRVLCKEMGL